MKRHEQERISQPIKFTLDGRDVVAAPGETIWQVAKREGVEIPHLCYAPEPGYRADGNCRACMVEIEGERVLAASCIRKPAQGMKVNASNHRAKTARQMVFELLVSDQPERKTEAHDPVSKFWGWADKMGVETGRFPERAKNPASDRSHPAMAVNLDACIHCNLCVRACREVQVNDVIGMAGRGHNEKIVFDFDDPMGQSTCVACGECVQACPTGALMPASARREQRAHRICRQAGGFGLPLLRRRLPAHLQHQGRQAALCYRQERPGEREPSLRERPLWFRLCAQCAAPDPADDPQGRRAENPARDHRSAQSLDAFPSRHLGRGAHQGRRRFLKIRKEQGPKGLAGFGSAKCSNEEAYLFQKLVRVGFGTNNVDHCTRLCHASSVAALLEGVGSAAVSATFNEVKNSDVIVVIGANPTENHPVAATFFKQAAKRGAKLVVMDPRGQALKRHAWKMMQFKNGADVAMLNGMLNVIVEEKLYDQQYVQTYTEGFEAFAEHIKAFTPEEMEPVCGIEADTLREVARTFARAENAIIFWGMGVSQHTHGTDNARCLIALSLITGQIGRPGTGLHPLRGQNNVQGASDAGLIPMFFPDYKSVENAETRGAYEKKWGVQLDPKRGLTVVEIMDAVHADVIRGMYIMGENPGDVGPGSQSRARGARASRASRGAGHLPHRDRRLCRRGAAVLGLAGKGRHRHQYQPASADGPQGAAAAGRCQGRLVDHGRARKIYGPELDLHASARGLSGNGFAACPRSTISRGSAWSAKTR